MKTLSKLRQASLFSFFFLLSGSSFASGSILGKVSESVSNQGIDGAIVLLESKVFTQEFFTNASGMYYASNIPVGIYDITVSFMGKTDKQTEIKLTEGETKEINFLLASAVLITPMEVIGRKATKPLFNVFEPDVQSLDRMDIVNSGAIKLSDAVGIQAGVTEVDGNYYVRGSRAGGMLYFIDGCKIMGNPNVPVCGVEVFKTYANYIPAKYGDTTGGVVAVETRNWFTE